MYERIWRFEEETLYGTQNSFFIKKINRNVQGYKTVGYQERSGRRQWRRSKECRLRIYARARAQ